ncbi:MAG: DUF4910 domain-containing protein [Candidatus Margulisiibacteriota bacterium]
MNKGTEIFNLIKELQPIHRSLTGEGVRETLEVVKQHVPLELHHIPSGTRVLDWVVPKEWKIKDAYIKNAQGEKVIDFNKNHLHVLGYSVPVKKKLSFRELKANLHTLPDHPDWIPYLTSYYKENWGFCLSHSQLTKLKDEEYEVCIESSLEDGNLNYGEIFIKGESSDEMLFSTYVCHPWMCNDNLSGVALAAFMAKHIASKKRRYSYRFLWVPETIGAIAWLSRNEDKLRNIKHGLVITCVGDPGPMTYKKTKMGNAEIDRAVLQVLKDSGEEFRIFDFFPTGSDERQYSSPGFNLPVGSLMRTRYEHFDEYHTSADDLDFIKPEHLADSFDKYAQVVDTLEGNRKYINLSPKGEPQLGRRGLYELIGGHKYRAELDNAVFWLLNLSDGNHDLLGVAERSKMKFDVLKNAADILVEKGLLNGLD